MRIFTTAPKGASYIQSWLDSRKNWPQETDFRFYTEGYAVDCPGKDVSEIPELRTLKARNAGYISPDWRFDVVKFSNVAFAAYDALYDHEGLGLRLDADCVTYKPVSEALIAGLVGDACVACYQRVGLHTETGIYILNGSHPKRRDFLDAMLDWYLSGAFKMYPQWHDCIAFDYALRATKAPVRNLSGEHSKAMHPQALSELGKYIDHQKGRRKELAKSPENKFREVA